MSPRLLATNTVRGVGKVTVYFLESSKTYEIGQTFKKAFGNKHAKPSEFRTILFDAMRVQADLTTELIHLKERMESV